MTPPTKTRLGRNAVLFFLALLVAWVFMRLPHADFIRLDDDVYVWENPHIQNGLSWESIRWAFTADFFNDSPHVDYWQPVTVLSHLIDITLFGRNPSGHHITNLLFHTANAMLLFLWLLQSTKAFWRSVLVSALFAVHPLQVETVAWITARKDLLAAFFAMLTLHAYTHYAAQPSRKKYAAVVLLFLASLMSKPVTMTLPLLMLFLDRWPLARTKETLYIREKIPFFLMALPLVALTLFGQPRSLERASPAILLMNIPAAYATHLVKTLFPVDLALWSPQRDYIPPVWMIAASTLLWVLISLAVLRRRKDKAYLTVGWFWFLILLAPAVALSPQGDRFMHLPLIGLLIMTVWGLGSLSFVRTQQKAVTVIAAALLAFYGICAYRQTAFWKDSFTLFSRSIAITPRNFLAYLNLGYEYELRGDEDRAFLLYQKALEANPAYEKAYHNVAVMLSKRGETEAAMTYFLGALEKNPALSAVHANMGYLLTEKGEYEEALRHFALALDTEKNPETYNNAGIAAFKQGRFETAADFFKKAVALKPDFPEAYNNLGNALIEEGLLDDALSCYDKALALNPDYAEAYNSRGAAFVKQKKFGEAETDFHSALRLAPDFIQAHINMGYLRMSTGREAEAIVHFSEAARIAPDDPRIPHELIKESTVSRV